MYVELKSTLCFILKYASWCFESTIYAPYNFLFFSSTEKQRAAEGLNGCLVIWHIHKSLCYKLLCKSWLSQWKHVLLSFCIWKGWEGGVPWHVIEGQRGIDSMGMPSSVRPRANSSTVSGRCCWMRADKTGLFWYSTAHLFLQHLLLLH